MLIKTIFKSLTSQLLSRKRHINVSNYPRTYALDKNGEIIDSIQGILDPEDFGEDTVMTQTIHANGKVETKTRPVVTRKHIFLIRK